MSNLYQRRILDSDAITAIAPNHLELSAEQLRARLWSQLRSKVHGLSFSAYLPGQGPEEQSQLSPAQIRARMEIIAPYCRWIRTFSCTDGNEFAPAIARELGLKTLVGAWIGDDADKNEREVSALIELARRGEADQVAVGNEVLLRGDLPEDELLQMITRVKQALPDVPVGYVDAYYLFEDHPRLVDACDVLFINCYPFWEKFELKASIGAMREMVARVRRINKGKPIVISETGWPTQGSPVGAAVPSDTHALLYALNTFEWTTEQDIPLFYFSSFDEQWKAGPEGDCGAFWGFWDQEGAPKHGG